MLVLDFLTSGVVALFDFLHRQRYPVKTSCVDFNDLLHEEK